MPADAAVRRNARHRLRDVIARLRDDRGLGLIEALLALTLTLVTVGISLNLLASSQGAQDQTVARADTVAQIHEGVARMMRELHQATDFNYVSSQVVDFDVWPGPGAAADDLVQVRYDCSQGGVCRRFSAPVGQPLPATGVLLVTGVSNADIFSVEPDLVHPSYVGVHLRLRRAGSSVPIDVSDGVGLPNMALG